MLPRDAPWLQAHQGKEEAGAGTWRPFVTTIQDSATGGPDHPTAAASQFSSTMSFPTPMGNPNPNGQSSPMPTEHPWSSRSKFLATKQSTQSISKSTLETSTLTSHKAYSDLSHTSQTQGPPASETAYTTSGTGGSIDHQPDWEKKRVGHTPQTAVYAAAGVITAVILASLGFFIFFYIRKRKRQAHIAAAAAHSQTKELPSARPRETQAYMAAPPPALTREPSYTAPPRGPPPPVILGPISGGSNGNYFTGIDTSDLVSVTSHDHQHRTTDRDDANTGLGNPFADSNSLNEEPPPPYRPRSLAFTLSRGSSLRTANESTAPSFTSRIRPHNDGTNPTHSPFDDSHRIFARGDDDSLSIISDPIPHHPTADNMSAVSDLSYQQESMPAGRHRFQVR